MEERVRVSLQDGVADVRLNRPDKVNALDLAMFDALNQTGQRLAAESTLRAVVLSGEGRGFCSGLDFSSFAAMADSGPRDSGSGGGLMQREPDNPANRAQRAAFVWTEVPVPVIAAIHGVAFGGGFQIAMAADIRFVAPDARLSVMEIEWGLIPDMTGPQMLRRLIPLDLAKDLTFTGRIFSGEEAHRMGLATHLAKNPLEAAQEMARTIASKSPHAVRAAKQLLDASMEIGLVEGLRLEAKLQGELIGQPNQVEAVRARIAKRAPRFSDPD